ncbi:uncharacterized protein [Maniola hyperantus]|uniref:uncharacterized protein n=1 Tax=Aphantopus hyperantus TaxID=2795564 RepID=UPI00374A271C
MTYISLHESVPTTIEAKRQLYQKLTLQCYLRGLKDPLDSRIRCMRPVSMEKALEFVQEELNTLYIQQRNEGGFSQKNFGHKFSVSNYTSPSRSQGFAMPGPSWQQPIYFRPPQSQQPMHFRPGWKPNPQMHPRGPSRTQLMFRAPPPNYNPKSNVFKLPNRHQSSNNSNFPRPMSGVSHFTPRHLPPSGHDWRKFGNPPPTNYMKSRDVNFNEYDYDYDYDYDYNYDYDYDNYEQFTDECYDFYEESSSKVEPSTIMKEDYNSNALSCIEVHVQELSSIDLNLSDGAPSIDDSGTLSAPEAEDGSRTATAHTDDESPILEIPITEDPLNKFTRQIVFNVVGDIKTKPVTTKPFENHKRTTVQLSESNLEEDVINAVKEFIQPKIKAGLLINPPLAMYKIIPIIQKTFKNSSMTFNLAKTEVENVREYLRQQQIIDKYHDGKTNHRGINECFLALSRKFYWPKMREHISKFINDCAVCGQAKYDRNPIRQQFQVVPPPSKPFELVHSDLLSVASCKFLTIVDSFSKYAQAYFLGDSTAVSVVQALLKFSTHHGNPLTAVDPT